MKLYRISQSVNNDRDTYDAAIVAALSEEAAKLIHPHAQYNDYDWMSEEGRFAYSWAPVKDIIVEYIGEAGAGIKEGVVLASFNAG